MQSTRLIFEKKSKFDTAFEGKAVENLYFCSQINRNLGASREQSQACLSYAEAKP